ncbi:MAG: sigma-70 family RNA polymerase sigma factor [Planctomycetota bacterium]|nr:sigma-70 family RNA polymerase sigma factor [Planctomycetota bacterium]
MHDTSLSLLDRLHRKPGEIAWRELVELYTPLLDNWLIPFQLQPADRDDVVQETLTTILQHVDDFRHRGQGSFRAWLRAIVLNRLREFWRRRDRHPQGTGDTAMAEMLQQLESPNSGLSQQWDAEHDRYVAHRLLARIEPLFEATTREAFRRVVTEGRPAREVAAELGISVNAVLLAKSRILRQLRLEMQGLT